MDLCEPQGDVCCKFDDGTVQIVPASDCPASQQLPAEMCEEVCCETAAGYQIVAAGLCPNAQVPMDLCEPQGDVCCKINGTYMTVPAGQCPTGSVLPDDYCKEVCCETSAGYSVLPFGLCPGGAVVPMDLCDPYEPCDEAVSGWCDGFDYTDQCLSLGGSCAPNAIFADQDCDGALDVCLICPAGTHPVDSNGDGCEDLCDCCEDFECPTGQIPVDSDGDGCPDTCKDEPCDAAISGWCPGYDYLEQCLDFGGGCGPDAILADSNCDGNLDVCQLCPPGTHAVDSNGDGCEDMCDCCDAQIVCPVGQVPVDSDGDGCPDTCKGEPCDDAISGWCEEFDYLEECLDFGGGCGPNAILADTDCDGHLDACQLCPPGTHAVDSNGDGCEDMCDCCDELLCPVGQVPVDADGDGCPDTCKGEPCDDAISGQCDGFDYADQCDPTGFDCGPMGILGDLDCDGKYEVCIECPAGTHPVDSNGDGCEDLCDCCQKLICPVGLTAVDTNGDGCPDTCKDEPCDAAISGHCEGFDYLEECLAFGGGCGPDAILADTDCDGHLDVCQLCPPGTHAVDSNGDGCEDMCDCCDAQILCPVGWVQVDTNGDGCPDTCKDKPCDDAVSGQCEGFDYSEQCDPTGLDCGPAGILADQDCDGKYEVCIECPPGTSPKDTNGDGCEDICDCDDGVVVDPDPTTEKAKTCKDLGGTLVTTVTGETACQVGLDVPCNCGGVCDGFIVDCSE